MGKKISIFYGIFSILFFIALFLLFLLRIGEIKKTNTQRIQAGFDQVRHIVETTYIRQASFDSLYFKDTVGKIFSLDKDLDLLVVYSYDTGIEYLRARNSRYLPDTDIASLRGVPRFSYNSFSRTQIASSITVPRKSSFIIEGVYRILRDRELFILIRDTVVILIIFIIITAALILLLRLLDGGKPAAVPLPLPAAREAAPAREAVPARPAASAPPPKEEPPPPEPANMAVPQAAEVPAASVQEDALPSELPPAKEGPAAPYVPVVAAQTAAPAAQPETQGDWRALIEERTSLALDNAAENEQDLSLAILKFSGLVQGSGHYQRMAEEIEKNLSVGDSTFNYPPNGYAVVRPNANLDQTIGVLRNFFNTFDEELFARYGYPLCGISSRAGRLIDGSLLLLESEEALKHTSRESLPDSSIGFKSDPGKYRAYLVKTETQKPVRDLPLAEEIKKTTDFTDLTGNADQRK
ncbi:MAG: hypothetical protein LBT33_04735 [Spirochaetia bacterium]|jgi:hypothetical protein|nr:hypothetical protein [Spirochaetia bacterium]